MMWVNLTRQKSGAIGKKLKRKSHACNIWTLIDTYIYIYIYMHPACMRIMVPLKICTKTNFIIIMT